MKILALETSAKSVSAAVTEDGRVLASGYLDTGLTHSRTLMPIVQAMLKNADLSISDCNAIAVAAGPGSFTGIRIGISAAKGLAFAANLPAVGVSTLEGMAQGLAHIDDALFVCSMDARRNQVYNALFTAQDSHLNRLTPDRAISLEALADEVCRDINSRDINIKPKIILVGDGANLCLKAFQEQGINCRLAPPQLLMQNAISVALCAERVMQAGKSVSAQELAPIYLRPPHAKTLRERQEHAINLPG